MKESKDYPIGTIVVMRNCHGAGEIEGKVISHPGPYSVTIQTRNGVRVSGSTTLLG